MSQTPLPSDVLIVGAGPTGLSIAVALLRHGITPRLIEKTPNASPNSKALGVMARTLELLAPSGITKELLAQGVKVPSLHVWSSGQHLARFDFATGITDRNSMSPHGPRTSILAPFPSRWSRNA